MNSTTTITSQDDYFNRMILFSTRNTASQLNYIYRIDFVNVKSGRIQTIKGNTTITTNPAFDKVTNVRFPFSVSKVETTSLTVTAQPSLINGFRISNSAVTEVLINPNTSVNWVNASQTMGLCSGAASLLEIVGVTAQFSPTSPGGRPGLTNIQFQLACRTPPIPGPIPIRPVTRFPVWAIILITIGILFFILLLIFLVWYAISRP